MIVQNGNKGNNHIGQPLDPDETVIDDDPINDVEQVIIANENSALDGIEWVDIIAVDPKNNEQTVVGQATRSAMRLHKLLHRATYLIVHDSNNNILVQKRTQTKDYYPGYWDAAAGGVVQAGEEWHMSMKREAQEELGITDIPFVDHGEFYYTDQEHHILGRLFSCIAAGPFDLQASEIEKVDWVSSDEILLRQIEFTPDSIFALCKWNNRHLTY